MPDLDRVMVTVVLGTVLNDWASLAVKSSRAERPSPQGSYGDRELLVFRDPGNALNYL